MVLGEPGILKSIFEGFWSLRTICRFAVRGSGREPQELLACVLSSTTSAILENSQQVNNAMLKPASFQLELCRSRFSSILNSTTWFFKSSGLCCRHHICNMCRPVSRDRSTSSCTAEPSRQGDEPSPILLGIVGSPPQRNPSFEHSSKPGSITYTH